MAIEDTTYSTVINFVVIGGTTYSNQTTFMAIDNTTYSTEINFVVIEGTTYSTQNTFVAIEVLPPIATTTSV